VSNAAFLCVWPAQGCALARCCDSHFWLLLLLFASATAPSRPNLLTFRHHHDAPTHTLSPFYTFTPSRTHSKIILHASDVHTFTTHIQLVLLAKDTAFLLLASHSLSPQRTITRTNTLPPKSTPAHHTNPACCLPLTNKTSHGLFCH
jgi:hypothetical protein